MMRSVAASSRTTWLAALLLLLLLSCSSPQTLMSTPLLDRACGHMFVPRPRGDRVFVADDQPLRVAAVSLPLFCPEEDWSRRLNCSRRCRS